MSFYIDTNTPDLQDFDPTQQGFPLPKTGIYPQTTFVIADSTPGETQSGNAKVDVVFEARSGEITGSKFKLTYNTGHSNPDTAKWAVQDLLRVVSAITGEKTFARGVNFDSTLYNRPFVATLEVTNQQATDANGNPYRNGKLKSFQFPEVAQPVGQPQQAQQPVGQPQQAAPQQYAQPQTAPTQAAPAQGNPPWNPNPQQ